MMNKKGFAGMAGGLIGLMIAIVIGVSVTINVVYQIIDSSCATGSTLTILRLLPLMLAVVLLWASVSFVK